MLEHVAELVGLDDLEVDLHARVREHARAGVARGVHGLDQRQLGERGDSATGSCAVAMMSRSLTESALRRSEPATSTRSAEGCERSAPTICSAMFSRAREQDARRRAALLRLGQGLEQRLLDLRAEAAQPADLLLLGGGAQGVERVDAELVVEPPRALGPEARQVHHGDQPGRELCAQALRGRDVARLVERLDLLLQRLADAADLRRAAVARRGRATDTEDSRTALAAVR